MKYDPKANWKWYKTDSERKKNQKKVIEFEIETNWELKNNIKKSHAMIYENNKNSKYFSLSTQALPLLSWEQNI